MGNVYRFPPQTTVVREDHLGAVPRLPRRRCRVSAPAPRAVSTGTLLDSKSELLKLSSGQTDKSQKVAICSLSQENRGSNALSFPETVIGAAVRTAVKK